MTDGFDSANDADRSGQDSERHDAYMRELLATPQGLLGLFNRDHPEMSVITLPPIGEGENLAFTVQRQGFLRDSRVFFIGHHYEQSKLYEIEVARPEGRFVWVSATPSNG